MKQRLIDFTTLRTMLFVVSLLAAMLVLPLEGIASASIEAAHLVPHASKEPLKAHQKTPQKSPQRTPKYLCGMSGRLLGASAQSYDEGQFLVGKGFLSCRSLEPSSRNQTRYFAIRIKLIGIGRGIDLSVLRSTRLRSSAIGLHGHPEEILGTYSIRKSGGAPLVKAGVDFDVPLHLLAHGRGSFELGLKGRDAARLGAKFHSMILKIENPEEPRKASQTKSSP